VADATRAVEYGFELDTSATGAHAGGVGHYRQYCPIARATEILGERWSLLVVRNLLMGADTFNAIARGVPTMSRSVLVPRLGELTRAGVVTTEAKPGGGSTDLPPHRRRPRPRSRRRPARRLGHQVGRG
jgi:hypothetical protein